ncbi:hypothetical protein, partial [Pseudomonas cannabina]|uniref:hypothetical protein n=1 Tax=Pseudomonas cannabina TaxID=86840 RepID=UPI001C7E99C9
RKGDLSQKQTSLTSAEPLRDAERRHDSQGHDPDSADTAKPRSVTPLKESNDPDATSQTH